MIAYVIALVLVFKWWYAPMFFVIGGLLTGVIFTAARSGGAAMAVVCVPLGIVLATIALFL